MAQDFNISAVTDAGRAAMQTALDNGYTMIFTKLATGSGTYSAGESVTGRTALKNQKNAYSFSSIAKDADGVTLKATIVNQESGTSIVPTTYNINEIGIFVTVNSVETLYAIAAVGGGTGAELPAYTGENAVEIIQSWHVANSNDADITIDMSTAFALASDLADEEEERIAADFENLYGLCTKNTHIGTNQQGNTEITETDTANSITAITTIVPTSSTVTAVTTVITPTGGDYVYTKTAVMTKGSSGTDVAESYTETAQV